MAPSRFPSNGTDWVAWTLDALEKRAVEFAGDLSPAFKRALAAARRKYEVQAVRVPRQPLAWGMQEWGPLPGTEDAHLMWEGPGNGLDFLGSGGAPAIPVRHPVGAGPFQTLREAERAARRFIAIGLDGEARETADA